MRILVVEDERRMAELLRRGLTEEGHQVSVARTGTEGLELALASPFDVIVLDVMLPQMDGMTVTRRLREKRNQTPVLMLTARDAASDIVSGLDCGADDYFGPSAGALRFQGLRSWRWRTSGWNRVRAASPVPVSKFH